MTPTVAERVVAGLLVFGAWWLVIVLGSLALPSLFDAIGGGIVMACVGCTLAAGNRPDWVLTPVRRWTGGWPRLR